MKGAPSLIWPRGLNERAGGDISHVALRQRCFPAHSACGTLARGTSTEALQSMSDIPIIDASTGRLLVDSQSREYRRYMRRQWLRIQRQSGRKRIDLWLSPAGYKRLLTAMKPDEPYSACIERILEDLPE